MLRSKANATSHGSNRSGTVITVVLVASAVEIRTNELTCSRHSDAHKVRYADASRIAVICIVASYIQTSRPATISDHPKQVERKSRRAGFQLSTSISEELSARGRRVPKKQSIREEISRCGRWLLFAISIVQYLSCLKDCGHPHRQSHRRPFRPPRPKIKSGKHVRALRRCIDPWTCSPALSASPRTEPSQSVRSRCGRCSGPKHFAMSIITSIYLLFLRCICFLTS